MPGGVADPRPNWGCSGGSHPESHQSGSGTGDWRGFLPSKPCQGAQGLAQSSRNPQQTQPTHDGIAACPQPRGDMLFCSTVIRRVLNRARSWSCPQAQPSTMLPGSAGLWSKTQSCHQCHHRPGGSQGKHSAWGTSPLLHISGEQCRSQHICLI